MPKLKFIIFISCIIFYVTLNAQDSSHPKTLYRKIKISDQTVVLDSTGKALPYIIWKNLLMSQDYSLKQNSDETFTLHRITDEEKGKRELAIPAMEKPRPSNAFNTGEMMYKIKTTDIYGNKINTKDMVGKIVVLNFWFVNCSPCRAEIPELNKIVADYKNDSSVVFIGIALDAATDIADFLLDIPFKYILVADGNSLKRSYNIKSYPTNVVIDKEGKVYFHTSGYAMNTAYWIRKSIEEIRSKQ